MYSMTVPIIVPMASTLTTRAIIRFIVCGAGRRMTAEAVSSITAASVAIPHVKGRKMNPCRIAPRINTLNPPCTATDPTMMAQPSGTNAKTAHGRCIIHP